MNPEIEKQWDEEFGLTSQPTTKSTRKESTPNRNESTCHEASITPTSRKLPISSSPLIFPKWISNHAAALFWFDYGLQVIPIVPGTKVTAVKWDQWLVDLCREKIKEYWEKHPNHELGFIVGDDMIVLDADSLESMEALMKIEAIYSLIPKLVIKTTKGRHHYYRRAKGTIAKSDSHSTEKYPNRLDAKTGRAMVVLVPSTGKSFRFYRCENKEGLSEVPQEFIDAVFIHNGREAPSKQRVPRSIFHQGKVSDKILKQLTFLLALKCFHPDCGYEDWLRTLMIIFFETKGSDEGLEIAICWSSKGNKYKGVIDIENKWKSFSLDKEKPLTIGTLIKIAKDAGEDISSIFDDKFEPLEDEVVNPEIENFSADLVPFSDSLAQDTFLTSVPSTTINMPENSTPLSKYYIIDIEKLEKQAIDQHLIFGFLVLMGQATVFYAAQNTGKTLLMLWLIIEGIKARKFDPSKLIYINMDDDSQGLITKLRFAVEYGFQMVADGHQGFQAKEFRIAMEKMISTDTASGVIIILDTLKKFVNTMKKDESADFARVVRQFVLKGGTVIALAHVNKNPGMDGKDIYSGTTDIIDDFDCGYILSEVKQISADNVKIVEFENIKRRGNVALNVCYSYAQESELAYDDMLLSIQEIDPDKLQTIKYNIETKNDAEVINAITTCISDGINTKMKMIAESAVRAKVSQRLILKVLNKYTGDNPTNHRWNFEVRERGAKVYFALVPPSATADTL